MNYQELDKDPFMFTEGNFCGREAVLVQPTKSDSGWTTENLNFRSIVFDKNSGEVLSNSFPKFFNEGQSSELYPNPYDFNDWEIREKIDGSTLVLDVVDRQINMRTRGILNYGIQPNAADFDQLLLKYPKLVVLLADEKAQNMTFLFEIVTPNNRIVINYPEVDFYLIGAIYKPTGYIQPESVLDALAHGFDLKRPKKYDLVDNLKEIVKAWKDGEGVVVTYNNGQNKVKIKSDRYCFLHTIMAGLLSRKDIIDRFIQLGFPNEEEFFAYYEKEFDYEIAVQLKPSIREILHDYRNVQQQAMIVEAFIDKVKNLPRREQAEDIVSHFKDWRRGYAFNVLDGKAMDNSMLKKLLV